MKCRQCSTRIMRERVNGVCTEAYQEDICKSCSQPKCIKCGKVVNTETLVWAIKEDHYQPRLPGEQNYCSKECID